MAKSLNKLDFGFLDHQVNMGLLIYTVLGEEDSDVLEDLRQSAQRSVTGSYRRLGLSDLETVPVCKN